MTTPEKSAEVEAAPFAEKVKTWHNKAEARRKTTTQLEVAGFKLIEEFIKEKFPKTLMPEDGERYQRYKIDSESVLTAAVALDSPSWFRADNWLKGFREGSLEISKPFPTYGVTSYISIEFQRGVAKHKLDGFDVYLKYSDGYVADIDTEQRSKVGDEGVEVKIEYRSGYHQEGKVTYQHSDKHGTDFVELLNQTDTLRKLGFVSGLLSEAFKRGVVRLI